MKKIFVIICFFVAANLQVVAQQKNEAQIRKQINQAASALNTMQCDFIQTKHMKMLNREMVSKGKLYYQKGNRLRWEYTTPYSYIFIINNDKVLLKNKQRNDVVDVNQNKLFKEIARIMMNSVVGNCISDDKSFKTSLATVKGEWVATLLPQHKNMKQMFNKIILHFSSKQAIVTQVELMEKNGDKTIIKLKNVKTNETISATMFSVR